MNVESHGGSDKHLIWIKYFTMKCNIKEVDIHLQTPIDQFLISFNYKPVPIRNVRKLVDKSSNKAELEKNLAEIFNFSAINFYNYFVFARLVSGQITPFEHSPNLELIPQFLLRGFIAFSYKVNAFVSQYLDSNVMDGFQEEYWELVHFPLLFLLKDQNELFTDTTKVIEPFLSAFSKLNEIYSLNDGDYLKNAHNLILSTILPYFSYELTNGTSFCFDFLINIFQYFSQQSDFENKDEIIGLFDCFLHTIVSVAEILNENQSKVITNLFVSIINKIPSFFKEVNSCSISILISGFEFLPYFIKYSNSQTNSSIIQSILIFLSWICSLISYSNIFEQVGIYNVKSKLYDADENVDNKNLKWNDWKDYFRENILLPEHPTYKITSNHIRNIISSMEIFFKKSFPVFSSLISELLNQISKEKTDDRFLSLIFLFHSLSHVENVGINYITSSDLLLSMDNTAFSSDLKYQMNQLEIQFNEVYLRFLYSFSCKDNQNLQLVLSVIKQKISQNNLSFIVYFMPLFRSFILIDSQIDFIHYFLESEIVENLQISLFSTENQLLINEIASFYQIMAISRPMEIFHSSTFLPILRNLLMIERLRPMLSPCFKIGLSLSHSPPFNIGKQSTHDTLEQINSILQQALQDNNLHDLAIQMVSYMTECTPTFDVSVFQNLYGLFESISKLILVNPTSDSFLKCLNFFHMFCAYYPQFLKIICINPSFQSQNLGSNISSQSISAVMRDFETVANKIQITKEIIDCLVLFMLNEISVNFEEIFDQKNYDFEGKIKNRAALHLLLQIAKDTDFEEYVLNLILNLCQKSMYNTFECFSCDVIGFALRRFDNGKYTDVSLELFRVIGTKFFSPLALNQTLKSMRLKDGKRCNNHQRLLDIFLEMMVADRPRPVTSFFHFAGKGNGVIIKNIDSSLFSEPYSFVTTLHVEKFQDTFYPILSISETNQSNKSFVAIFIKNDMIVVQYNDNPGYILRYNFSQKQWYKIIAIFNPACLQVIVNDQELTPLSIMKHDFRDKVTVTFGIRGQSSFIGDFGPSLFIRATNSSVINETYQKNNLSRIYNKNIFIKFLPWLVKDESISDVIAYENLSLFTQNRGDHFTNDSYPFSGDAIPSCMTITQMVQSEGILQKILPLFILLNYPTENDVNIKNDHFFPSILIVLQHLLSLSEKMQNSFEKIGGFQLLSGIISSIKAENFTQSIAGNLYEIFQWITVPSLRNQMIEHIWLNLDLWSLMNYQLQQRIYSEVIDSIWTIAKNLNTNSFTIPSLDVLLYQVHTPFDSLYSQYNDKNMSSLLFFDASPDHVYQCNKPCILTKEQMIKIKQLQWKIFGEYLLIHPSASTYIEILMIMCFHKEDFVKKFALQLIYSHMKEKNNDLLVSLDMIDCFDCFLSVYSIIPILVLKSILLYGQIQFETAGKFAKRAFTFSKALDRFVQYTINSIESSQTNIQSEDESQKEEYTHLNTLDNENIKLILQQCFTFLFTGNLVSNSENINIDFKKAESVKHPELFTIFFYFSHFIERRELRRFATKLELSFTQFPNDVMALFDNDGWVFWIFLFAFNAYSIINDAPTFAYFFSIIFTPLLLNDKIQYIKHFFLFLDLLTIYSNTSFINLKLIILRLIISTLLRDFYSIEIKEKIIPIVFGTLFISINQFDKNIDYTKLNNEILINFIKKMQDDPDNIIQREYSLSFSDNDHNIEVSIELMELLLELIKIKSDYLVSVGEIDIAALDLFFYLSHFIKQFGTESLIISSQKYFDTISSLVPHEVLMEYSHLSKSALETKMKIDNLDIFTELYQSNLKDELLRLSNSLKSIKFDSEDIVKSREASQQQYFSSFSAFNKAHSETKHLMILHNQKFSTSFIREITSNSGPWSTIVSSKSYWKSITKVDDEGHNIYRLINRNFDNHEKASLLRDAWKNKDKLKDIGDPNEQNIIQNFHRILIQNTSFVPLPTEKGTTITFKTTQFTLLYHISGILYVTDRRVIFDGSSFINNFGDPDQTINHPHKFIEIPINKISFIFKRNHQHCDIGIEIFTFSNKSYFFIFDNINKRNQFIDIMKKRTSFIPSHHSNSAKSCKLFYPLRAVCNCCVQTMPSWQLINKSKITKMWQSRKISNFTYLYYLNMISGRSFNDISQYPIYPWILSDYTSDTIDLNDENVYRDLSRPIGSYNEERLDVLLKNMTMDDPYQRCLYRTHFSSPAVVAGYLIRTEPYSSLHIRLQQGRFDLPGRIFFSIKNAWASVTGPSNDFRELIPEFFCSEHFLMNENGFDLGLLYGKRIENVELPNWAKTPHDFINIHRMALESEYVSSNLEQWIDLIFGVNQMSIEKNNVFHLFSYTDALPSEIVDDPDMFYVAQNHAVNFGVFPTKLFKSSHPKRDPVNFKAFKAMPSKSNSTGILFNMSYGLNVPPSSNGNLENSTQSTVSSQTLLPGLDSNVIFCKNGFVITKKPSLINLSNGSTQSLPIHITGNMLLDYNEHYLFEVSRGGTCVSAFSLKKKEEVGLMPHNNSSITSLYCIGPGDPVLVGGADCSIDIWTGDNLEFLGSITSHTMPIVTVVGNMMLDIVVSLDEGNFIFVTTLKDRKYLNSFNVECPAGSIHLLCLLQSGMIVLSSSTPGESNSSLLFFTIYGDKLATIQIPSTIESLETISTKQMNEFVVVATSMKSIFVYECSRFTLVKKINEAIIPKFISTFQDERLILAVKMKQHQQTLVAFEI